MFKQIVDRIMTFLVYAVVLAGLIATCASLTLWLRTDKARVNKCVELGGTYFNDKCYRLTEIKLRMP